MVSYFDNTLAARFKILTDRYGIGYYGWPESLRCCEDTYPIKSLGTKRWRSIYGSIKAKLSSQKAQIRRQ